MMAQAYPFPNESEASADIVSKSGADIPQITVPGTISEDNTNKNLVVEGFLRTITSRQSRDVSPSLRAKNDSELPEQEKQHHLTERRLREQRALRHQLAQENARLAQMNKRSQTQVQRINELQFSELGVEEKINTKERLQRLDRPSRSSYRREKSPPQNYTGASGSNQLTSILGASITTNSAVNGEEELHDIKKIQDIHTNTPNVSGLLKRGASPLINENISKSTLVGFNFSPAAPRLNDASHFSESPAGTGKKDSTKTLQEQIRQLEARLTGLGISLHPEKQILYRIFCKERAATSWLDKPRTRNRRDNRKHYEADIPIPDEMAFFERNDHVHFVIYQDFECCGHSSPKLTDPETDDEEHSPHKPSFTFRTRPPVENLRHITPESRINKINGCTFAIISKEFGQLIRELQWKAKIPDWNQGFKRYNPVDGPHHCILYNITSIRKFIDTFGSKQQHLLNLLFDHIIDNFGLELQNAIELFDQGRVSKETICYLMRPEGLIVSHDKLNCPQAFVVGTWPSVIYNRLSFMAWSWKFNGVFKKHETKIEIALNELFGDCDEIDIKKLPYYPLKYADPEEVSLLTQRGIVFWSCRYQRIVDYSGWDVDDNEQFDNVRFIIDTMTYRKMHSDSTLAKEPLTDSLGERMNSDTPLEGDQLLVFPPTIYGFHVQEKKWFNLKVDNLMEVQWNKEAFDSLVIDESTKLLIVALVSNKIAADSGTDLISNKGNGLVILLHGYSVNAKNACLKSANIKFRAPGTGKTLTAESVAEYAEKPLYRVTTGDIGTDPEAVEKYLTSVLYLGKIWGCVVLLDEADVFLEERTLSDLRRNALVSVFLRVLEYYDGIIILTSNRVGTFDSAFKSRIQLAIHYDDLSQAQRIKIWQSFIKRLEDVAPDAIDIKELSLEKNIRKLAKHDLNGRQIRNNITTARQLALYKKELMNMSHLETVVRVSQKFESYLRDVKAGLDDNQIAREDGLR